MPRTTSRAPIDTSARLEDSNFRMLSGTLPVRRGRPSFLPFVREFRNPARQAIREPRLTQSGATHSPRLSVRLFAALTAGMAALAVDYPLRLRALRAAVRLVSSYQAGTVWMCALL